MKRFLAVVCCFACAPLCALSLDGESKREAKLFNSFLSSVYALRSNDAKAFSKLQKTLALQPDSKYLKRLLVSAAVADNRPDLAAEYADFISSGENTADDWSVYGAYLWKKGDLAAAREAYQQALKQSDDLRIMFQYVTLLSGMAPAQAAAALEELAASEPDFASPIYTEIGNLFLQRGDLNLALGYFNKAVEAAPLDPAPRLGRGEVYEKASQYFLMLHEFEELEKMGFGNAATYSRMGSVFLLVKDYPKAEEYFLKAKADDNGDVPSAYFLSLLAEQKEDYARAADYLKDAADYQTSASKCCRSAFIKTN
ncbi:MAG: tetratricopeptide repeat protein [Elusimicrobiales bacterium]|nr:tetratricopeptide repeat protein [Elusimicrobiales bacterium]